MHHGVRMQRESDTRHGVQQENLQQWVQPELMQHGAFPGQGEVGSTPPQRILTQQEPSYRDCVKELPPESVLPKLTTDTDFLKFWIKFEEAAKDNAWPDELLSQILQRRSTDRIQETLRLKMPHPKSRKELKDFLRATYFRTTDFKAARDDLAETKQYLREGVEDWELRLQELNDNRIDLDNEEGLQMYRLAVLPVYRLMKGNNIAEFMNSCRGLEKELREGYGNLVYHKHLFRRGKSPEDYAAQLSSYERKLMDTDTHKILERLRDQDMEPAADKIQPLPARYPQGRINALLPGNDSSSEVQCTHCHRKGHAQADCWNLHPEKRPRRDRGEEGRRPTKHRRMELPAPKFPGHCMVCEVFHPSVKSHVFQECPFRCPTCGPGTHSITLCPFRNGSGSATESDHAVEEA
jgi:hypothetical protein